MNRSNYRKILIPPILLALAGLVFLSISSLVEAENLGNKFLFIRKQLLWTLISLIAFFVVQKINLQFLRRYSLIIYFSSVIILLFVLLPTFGTKVFGARRWLSLGFLPDFQPSEFFKPAAIFFFSSLFSQKENLSLRRLLAFLFPPILLVLLQPNFSTAILLTAIIVTLYYLAGGQTIPLFLLSLFATAASILLVVISPYRLSRLNTMLHPESSPDNYHYRQIVISLSSGGIFGKGLANSDQKYRFLPKIATDSILAVIGEETGIIGVFLVFFLYLSLISSLFSAAKLTSDPFSSLFLSGIGLWIAYQSLINIFSITGLIPLTGVPLPFISYGGSSLLCLSASLGICRQLLYSNSVSPRQKTHHHRQSSYSSH